MNIEIFSLCRAATSDSGNLNILGAFDTIWAIKMPVVYPQCTVALRIRFTSIEKGEHKVSISFADADGQPVIPPLNGTIKIDFPKEQQTGSANLILNIQQLNFKACGEYSIDLAIDGRQDSTLPLHVKEKRNR